MSGDNIHPLEVLNDEEEEEEEDRDGDNGDKDGDGESMSRRTAPRGEYHQDRPIDGSLLLYKKTDTTTTGAAAAAATTTTADAPDDDATEEAHEEEKDNDNDNEFPFDWILQCKRRREEQDDDDGANNNNNIHNNPQQQQQVLLWHSPNPPTSLAKEQALLDGKLLSWGARERGMMKSQPNWRKEQLKRLCQQCHVPLPQALSLRRHHMKQLNLYKTMTALGLGHENDIRESSRIFEQVVSEYLIRQGISFYSEHEQKEHIRKYRNIDDKKKPFPPTPDFVLQEEIIIEKYHWQTTSLYSNPKPNQSRKRGRQPTEDSNGSGGGGSGGGRHRKRPQHKQQERRRRRIIERRKVCWIDAKMFYGASTIRHDDKSAVGCLLSTARKYNAVFGPGAFVFMLGYGDQLARELEQEGAMALDCSSGSGSSSSSGGRGRGGHDDDDEDNDDEDNDDDDRVLLQPVQDHQRTWCADKHGHIWP